MEKSILVLLISSLAVAVECGSIPATNDEAENVSAWQELDDFLIKGIDSKDAAENMALALKWLEELRAKDDTSGKEGVIAALELLEHLKLVVEGFVCTKDSQAFRESLHKIILNSGKREWSRVPLVMYYYAGQWTEICQLEYVSHFMVQLQFMSKEPAVEQIRPFFMEIIHSWISDPALIANSFGADQVDYTEWAENPKIREAIYNRFVMNVPMLKSDEDATIAYEAIELLAKQKAEHNQAILAENQVQEIQGKPVITGKQAKELFSRLIVDSCKVYAKYVGPNVFDLAQADIFYTKDGEIGIFYEMEFSDYYLAWAQYRACKSLIENKPARQDLLERIANVADERAEKTTRSSEEASELHDDLMAKHDFSLNNLSGDEQDSEQPKEEPQPEKEVEEIQTENKDDELEEEEELQEEEKEKYETEEPNDHVTANVVEDDKVSEPLEGSMPREELPKLNRISV